MKEMLETISIDFVHSKSKSNEGITLPTKTIEEDPSFKYINNEALEIGQTVSSDSSFFRGCVSLHR